MIEGYRTAMDVLSLQSQHSSTRVGVLAHMGGDAGTTQRTSTVGNWNIHNPCLVYNEAVS